MKGILPKMKVIIVCFSSFILFFLKFRYDLPCYHQSDYTFAYRLNGIRLIGINDFPRFVFQHLDLVQRFPRLFARMSRSSHAQLPYKSGHSEGCERRCIFPSLDICNFSFFCFPLSRNFIMHRTFTPQNCIWERFYYTHFVVLFLDLRVYPTSNKEMVF